MSNCALYIGASLNIPPKIFHIPGVDIFIMVDHQRDIIFQHQQMYHMYQMGFIRIQSEELNPFVFINVEFKKIVYYFYSTVFPNRCVFPWIPEYPGEMLDLDTSRLLDVMYLCNRLIIGEHIPDKTVTDYMNIEGYGNIELYFLNKDLFEKYRKKSEDENLPDNYTVIASIREKRIVNMMRYL